MAVQRTYPDPGSMARQALAALAIYAAVGCMVPAHGTASFACAEFLDGIKAGGDGSPLGPVIYDLEKLLDRSSSVQLTAAYDALHAIDSDCAPGEISPVDPEEIKAPWNARKYVDVASGISGETRWIQFVYPSIGDAGPGFSSSVVFYDEYGHPKATNLVSEIHSWENTVVLRSMMFEGEIISCRQHIEHFFYDLNGDVGGELNPPRRSGCEHISVTYPYP